MLLSDIQKASNVVTNLKEAEKALCDFSRLHEKRKTMVCVQSNQTTYCISCSKAMLIYLAKAAIEHSVEELESYGVTVDNIATKGQ